MKHGNEIMDQIYGFNNLKIIQLSSLNKLFRKEADDCKRKEINDVVKNMQALNNYQNALRKLDLQIEKERYRVCAEAKTKYIPNGLITSIPENWNCTFDQSKYACSIHVTHHLRIVCYRNLKLSYI